ncbi:MAG: hypothetical protein R3A47_03310 [Polyangiales bacterium]
MVERRVRRSEDPYKALCFQLEHARECGGLEAVVVAMKNGMLVASAGDRAICEELGAVAPLLCRSVFSLRMPELLGDADVAVRAMSYNGEELYLATVGGGMARDALLRHSQQGVRRILQSN